MRTTYYFIAIVLAVLILPKATSAQDAFSLEEAIDYALSKNIEVVNAKLAIEDAEKQITERLSVGLPKLDGSVEFNHYPQVPQQALPDAFAQAFMLPEGETVSFLLKNNFTAGLTASSLLFDGTYLTGVKAAKRLREYTKMELVTVEQKTRNDIMNAYLPSLLISESVKTIDKNIKNLEQVLFETKEIYKAGFIEQLDVDRLELSLANLVTERENLIQQKDIALNALKFTMNFPMADEMTLNDDINSLLEEASDEELTGQVDYLNRAEFQVAEIGLQLGELNIEQYERANWPSLAAFAGYQQQYQGDDFTTGFWAPTFVLGAKLSVSIFDGFGARAKKERAMIDLKKNMNSKNMLVNLIEFEVANARKSYSLAKQRLQSQEKNLGLAERIYNTTKIKYKEGVGSSLEVTQSEQALYQTQQNKIQAMFDLLKAKMALEQALGVTKF